MIQKVSAVVLCLPLWAVFPGITGAQDGTPVPDQLRWRPTGDPDRILLSWTGDPATTASVSWRTDATVAVSIGEIALADDGPKFAAKAVSVTGKPVLFTSDLGNSHRHSLTFTDLSPATQYVWRVGDGTNWSEWSQFRTAAAQPEAFSFIYFGDAQNTLKSHWSRVVRQAWAEAPRSAFLLHAGDLINRANADAEWGEWFYAGGFIHHTTPCLATPGNHEYAKAGLLSSGKLSDHWRPTFAFPENGPPGLEETCWWLDYQGVRLVSLNSNENLQLQADWLKEVLRENPQTWTIITYHHPLYSAKAGRDNSELRRIWQPVFDEFRADLVLQGHDHTYARTGLMNH
ncbi:MAG: metallophosphoesterase family protein, partial [Planctomycetaceae bacterium]|nr:metallophosphoesterase family protein [Planctomycetaceae bacterium]